MKRRLVLTLALLLGLPAATRAQEAVTPTFFAVSVADLDTSIEWYTRTLDLAVTRLPEGSGAKFALLQGQGLVVELVEHPKAFDLRSRLPELENRYLGHGLFKVGFFVADLDGTVDRLRARGVTFRGGIITDSVLGARSILLLDNTGNVIQLFQRLASRQGG